MAKKGGDLEILAMDFLEKIFKVLQFAVVHKRVQLSGSQDGCDNLIGIVDKRYLSRSIYSKCKDYTSELNYTDAMIKLPQLASEKKQKKIILMKIVLIFFFLYLCKVFLVCLLVRAKILSANN